MTQEFYAGLLTKIIQGAATYYERSQVERYENANPVGYCSHCQTAVRTVDGARVRHPPEECEHAPKKSK